MGIIGRATKLLVWCPTRCFRVLQTLTTAIQTLNLTETCQNEEVGVPRSGVLDMFIVLVSRLASGVTDHAIMSVSADHRKSEAKHNIA